MGMVFQHGHFGHYHSRWMGMVSQHDQYQSHRQKYQPSGSPKTYLVSLKLVVLSCYSKPCMLYPFLPPEIIGSTFCHAYIQPLFLYTGWSCFCSNTRLAQFVKVPTLPNAVSGRITLCVTQLEMSNDWPLIAVVGRSDDLIRCMFFQCSHTSDSNFCIHPRSCLAGSSFNLFFFTLWIKLLLIQHLSDEIVQNLWIHLHCQMLCLEEFPYMYLEEYYICICTPI